MFTKHTSYAKKYTSYAKKSYPKLNMIREGTEDESVNEPDKDGFMKLTKAEQLELPFNLPDREKG